MKYMKIMFYCFLIFALGFFAVRSIQDVDTETDMSANHDLMLKEFNGGIFTVEKPLKWEVISAGYGSTFSFLIRDPEETARQLFYFGEVGPVYLDQKQRQVDKSYMDMGGFPIQWINMPVVNPLTAENFLKHFENIMATQIAQNFMPQMSHLNDIEIISNDQVNTPFTGGHRSIIRALFRQDGKLCEGMFSVTAAPLIPFMNSPGGGIGYGFMFTGIAAPKKEFAALEKTLLKSLKSFTFSQEYLNQCMADQNKTWQGVFQTCQILNHTSDTIMEVWDNRNRTYDIISEKRSDAILGVERLYNPDTGQVYEFENGFYDTYNLNRNKYNMNNLQLLPSDNYGLWMTAPLDGYLTLN